MAMNLDALTQPASRWLSYPVVMVLGAVVFAGAWMLWHPASDPAGQIVIATPAREVRELPKVDVPVKSVRVIKAPAKVRKKLLPAPVAADPKQEVIASNKIPAGERPHTVTTVINTETGQSETYVRTDPLPLIAWENRGEVGLYYGLKGGERTVRLQARQDFVQVKALHVGVIGSIDKGSGRPDYFLGLGVSYKW